MGDLLTYIMGKILERQFFIVKNKSCENSIIMREVKLETILSTMISGKHTQILINLNLSTKLLITVRLINPQTGAHTQYIEYCYLYDVHITKLKCDNCELMNIFLCLKGDHKKNGRDLFIYQKMNLNT